MIRKRALINEIYKQKKKKLSNLGIADEFNQFSDTKCALLHVKSLFPTEKFLQNLPPIVMKHQIYALISNRTEVDKTLNEMKKNGEIRLFKLGANADELAVVFLEDYKKHVEKQSGNNAVTSYFVQNVICKCPDISYNKDVLLKEYLLKEENISELIQHGILTARDVGCYWLSIPQTGEFVKALLLGRRVMLQHIRRTKYNEILQSELERRKLPKKAILGILYYIYDLVGSDLVTCIETSSGRILRLQSESGQS